MPLKITDRMSRGENADRVDRQEEERGKTVKRERDRLNDALRFPLRTEDERYCTEESANACGDA